jgi:hypothetical protein
LHWAASSDDVEVLDALLDAGADIDAPGAVMLDRLRAYCAGPVRPDPADVNGAQWGMRSLTRLGWTRGRPDPLQLILQAHGLNPTELADSLVHATSQPT